MNLKLDKNPINQLILKSRTKQKQKKTKKERWIYKEKNDQKR